MKNIYRKYLFLLLFCVLCMLPQQIYAEDKEIDFNKKKKVAITDTESFTATNSYVWLKYVPKADGYLTIQVTDAENGIANATGYVTLYDSAKTTVLSSKSIFYNTTYRNNAYWNKFSFGLVKDQTYYFRIKADNAVTLTRKFTKTKDKSGDVSGSALELKKNKYKVGMIPAGISDVDWYRIQLTKPQKLQLYYNVKTNGSFRIFIYYGSQLIGTRNIYHTPKARKIIFSLKTNDKKTGMKTGTYYIRVERNTTDSSGYYKIKWK